MLFASSPAWARDFEAILKPRDPGARISGLAWSDQKYRVASDGRVVLKGGFVREGWDLMLNSLKVKRNASGEFEFALPLSSRSTPLEVASVGPRGEVSKESLLLEFEDWGEFVRVRQEAPVKTGFTSVGAQASGIAYRQSYHEDLSESVLTVKGGYTRLFGGGRWSLGGGGYFTALPITRSRDATLRFAGFNLRAGIHPESWDFRGWRFSVLAGYYFTTTFATGEAMGMKDMNGPQLFPSFRKEFGTNALSGYLKFSPVTNGLVPLSITNREVAIGGAYEWPLADQRTLAVTLDVAQIRLASAVTTINSESVSLGAAYNW